MACFRTTSSMRTLFPRVRLGYCLRHALNKLPSKRIGLSAPVRQGLRSTFHTLLYRCRQRKSLRVVSLGQRLRHFVAHITTTVGPEHGVGADNRDKSTTLESNKSHFALYPTHSHYVQRSGTP